MLVALLLVTTVACATVAAALIAVRAFCVHLANVPSGNLGNQIDRVLLIYVAVRGDADRFRRLRKRALWNRANYPDSLVAGLPFRPLDLRGDPLWQRVQAEALAFSMVPSLWQTPLACKERLLPCVRACVDGFLRAHAAPPAGLPLPARPDTRALCCVHVRCSDVPFERTAPYYLYGCEWYARAVRLALGAAPTVREIVLLSCAEHRNPARALAPRPGDAEMERNRAACAGYLMGYRDFLRAEFGLPTSVACGSLAEDVETMRDAACLVAGTGSLAYYVGLASDNVFVVSESMARGSGFMRTNMYMVPGGGHIEHRDVRDYHDPVEMARLLRCGPVE